MNKNERYNKYHNNEVYWKSFYNQYKNKNYDEILYVALYCITEHEKTDDVLFLISFYKKLEEFFPKIYHVLYERKVLKDENFTLKFLNLNECFKCWAKLAI